MINNNILRAVLESMSKEQKEQLIAELIAEVGDLQPASTPEVQAPKPASPVAQVSESNGFSTDWGKNIDGKRPVRAQANTWVDSGESKDEEYNPDQYQKVPRQRQDAKTMLVEKTCSSCNKKFKINSSLVYGEFIRCDRCTG